MSHINLRITKYVSCSTSILRAAEQPNFNLRYFAVPYIEDKENIKAFKIQKPKSFNLP